MDLFLLEFMINSMTLILIYMYMDADVSRRASYGVYISQVIRFARVCNHVADFNARKKCLKTGFLCRGVKIQVNTGNQLLIFW